MSNQMPIESGASANFQPNAAKHFELLDAELHFTPEEIAALQRNSFFVSDRLAFEQFKRAYAYIYWKDLPVLITADSISHSIHQTYDKMLAELEQTFLTLELSEILVATLTYIRNQAKFNQDERLSQIYRDLDTYLTVPLILLEKYRFFKFDDPLEPSVKTFVQWITDINSSGYHRNRQRVEIRNIEDLVTERITIAEIGIQEYFLFGVHRSLDFTLFQARGHYDYPDELQAYFTAMMWLSLIDFEFIGVNPAGQIHLQPGPLAAAHILRDALAATSQRQGWDTIDRTLNALIGWSDNITLAGLDRFIADAQINNPADYFDADNERLLQMLTDMDYGKQRIRGQGQLRAKALKGSLPHTTTFVLIGQRFTLESYLMAELVFDKLLVNGEVVKRPYPSPLDVMAILGNDRAVEHLKPEFERYGYQSRLYDLRTEVMNMGHEFWNSTLYNSWLNVIRTLGKEKPDARYPHAMQTKAWDDKTLHSQLGAWTELRHDNILYVKPPFEPRVVCEYPAGYVEPYVAFYTAITEYARLGQALFDSLPIPLTREFPERESKTTEEQTLPVRTAKLLETMRTYFAQLEQVAITLSHLSEKELNGQSFTEDEERFLRSVVVRKYVGESGYGGYTEEDWDGWYNDLLPFGDESAVLVTDVYTNSNPEINPQGVLHMGLGDPVVTVMLTEVDQKQAIFVGPAYAYFEHLETGLPPKRLTDEEWSYAYGGYARERLKNLEESLQNRPDGKLQDITLQRIAKVKVDYERTEAVSNAVPKWTQSFRLSIGSKPGKLVLPSIWEALELPPADVAKLMESHGRAHTRMYQFANLIELIRPDPAILLTIEGFTPAKMERLLDYARHAGFLPDEEK